MGKDLLVQIAGDETQLNRALDRAEARLGKYGASVVAQADTQAAAYKRIGDSSAMAAGQADRYAMAQEASNRRVKTSLTEMVAAHSHAMQSVGDTTVAAGRKLSSAGSTMLGVVAPLDLAGAAAGKLAIDFSRSMELIHTQANYSQRDVEKLSKAVLELSPKTGNSPKELADGLYHIASGGLKASEAMQVLEQAAIGAKIGGAGLDETAYALTAVMRAMPHDIANAKQAMGEMDAIVGMGDMRMSELVGALSTGLVAAGKTAGLGLRDLGAGLDVMTQRGMPAEQSATRLAMTLALMQKHSGPATKALASIGMNTTQLSEDLRKPQGLLVAFEDLDKHLTGTFGTTKKGLSEAATATLNIFGGGRSGKAAELLVENVKSLREQYEKLPDAGGAVKRLERNWTDFNKIPAQELAKDQQEINVALIKLGDQILPTVLPVVKELSGTVGELAADFKSLSPGVQKGIIDFALAGTAIALVSKPIGAVVTGIGLIEKGLGTGGEAAAKFAGTFGSSLDGTVPVAEASGAAAGNAYGAAFAVAADRGVAEVRLASTGAGGSGLGPYMIPGVGKSKVPGFGPRAGVPGLGPTGFTAAEQAVAMDSMALPAVAQGPGLAAILKGIAGNAVKGGVIGVGGVMASQLAGSAVGGSTGKAIAGIGTDTALGAAIGTAIAPGLGTAIGGGLGAIAGALTHLDPMSSHAESQAERATRGLPNYGQKATDDLQSQIKKLWDTADKEIGHLRPGMPVSGVRGAGGVNQPGMSPEDRRRAEGIKQQAELKEGGLIGKQEASYIQSGAVLPQLSSIVETAKKKMKELGPAAKDGMYSAMVGMVKELESKGRLPQGATKAFIDTMHKQFSTLGTYSKEAAAVTVREWELNRVGGAALKSADAFVGHILGAQKEIPLSAKTTTQETGKFFTASENELLTIVKHSTGERHRIALQAYNELRSMDAHFYAAQHAEAASQLSSINDTIKSLSHKGSKAFIAEWQSIEAPLKKLWEEGYLTTEKYTAKMNEVVEGELSSLGVKPNAVGKKAAKFGAGPGSSNGLVSGLPEGVGHAAGGYIGSPGERGRDEVPIWVGRGEAVANHDQQPYIETGLAMSKAMGMQPYGSLHELFANVKTTHYAGGGVVAPQVHIPGAVGAMAQGGLNVEARALNRVLKAAQPKGAHSASVTAAGGAPTGGGYDPSQTVNFEGVQIARWILPENLFGRAHGWTGPVTSGIRLGFDPHAPSGSEHALNVYPGGAEDFGGMVDPAGLANRAAFIRATASYTGKRLLTPIGFRDDGHMSGTGHAQGGMVAGEASLVAPMAGQFERPPMKGNVWTPKPGDIPAFYKLAHNAWSKLSGMGALPSGAHFPGLVTEEGGEGAYTEGHTIHEPWHNIWSILHGAMFPSHDIKRLGLIHEFAHTMQSPSVRASEHGSTALAEGGAQAWADEMAPLVFPGLREYGDSNYSGYVSAAKKRGTDWILHKQFGYAGGGFVDKSGLESLWVQAGGSRSATNVAASVALAESGGDPQSTMHDSDGSVDRGLWQINSVHGSLSTYGEMANAQAAVSLSHGGQDWSPWVTYKSGAYRKFLGQAASAGSTAAGNSTAEAAHLEGRLDTLKREKINLPTPAAGKAGAHTRAADTAARKRIANEELTIREKLKRLPKKAASGLHLSTQQEATVQRFLGAAAGEKATRAELGTEAGEAGGMLQMAQARWSAQPQDLKTAQGANTQMERDKFTVSSDKAVLKYYREELAHLQKEAKQFGKLRDYYRHLARKVHGSAKKQALDKAASYQSKITTAQNDAKALKGSIFSQETTIIEAENAVSALPGEVAAAKAQAHDEALSGDLSAYQAANSKVDLEQRAGDLTPAQAKAAKEANARKALGGGFGELTSEALLQVKGDLKELSEATQEATSALEAHTQALKDSAKVLNDFLRASDALAQVENGSILRSMADLISGQIAGVDYHGRRLSPGSGKAASY